MSSTVLVLNCGSSSIKYQLVDPDAGNALAKGSIERIGEEHAPFADHEAGMRAVLAALGDGDTSLATTSLVAVGHRVVHGGDRFADPTLIDDDIVDQLTSLSTLAPLHNPPNLTGIRVARQVLPDVPHVAVFDTAFHQTLPPAAYTYALDREVAREYRIRRYGFHGTSVAYVTGVAAQLLGRDVTSTNLIVLHLGNGASATAVRGGCSVDTSMGLTPLEGLVMGTRSGDLDPGAVFHLAREAGLASDKLDDLLNKRSGLLGLVGDNDMREVQRRADEGDESAVLAREVYAYRIRKYVGAYSAVLGRVDGIVFTAGVGENNPWIRSESLSGLERLGIEVDEARNAEIDGPGFISPDGAAVPVLVVPTNEELEIARQARSCC